LSDASEYPEDDCSDKDKRGAYRDDIQRLDERHRVASLCIKDDDINADMAQPEQKICGALRKRPSGGLAGF